MEQCIPNAITGIGFTNNTIHLLVRLKTLTAQHAMCKGTRCHPNFNRLKDEVFDYNISNGSVSILINSRGS